VRRAILARHGETALSALGRTNGDPAVANALTEAGRAQARELGRALSGERIELCVTSEFQRTRETADLVLEGRDTARVVLPELNDIRFGEFEGRALTDYRAWAHAHSPLDPAPGRGDSRAETVARYVGAYRTILARPEETVLVVAHGLPVRYVLEAVEGRTPAAAVAQVPYAQAFCVDADTLGAAVGLLGRWAAAPAWSGHGA
jgi:2,3-bisphosphoglycerate-dependent phosphoglycerate mutase